MSQIYIKLVICTITLSDEKIGKIIQNLNSNKMHGQDNILFTC